MAHVVMDGQTYTFRILIGSTMVNYRKTYTLQGGPSGKSLPISGSTPSLQVHRTSFVLLFICFSLRACGLRWQRYRKPRRIGSSERDENDQQ